MIIVYKLVFISKFIFDTNQNSICLADVMESGKIESCLLDELVTRAYIMIDVYYLWTSCYKSNMSDIYIIESIDSYCIGMDFGSFMRLDLPYFDLSLRAEPGRKIVEVA